VTEITQAQALKAEPVKTSGIWEKDSFSFWDILDAINPLQYIPIISTIYRNMAGDKVGYAARITGDTLYSGLFDSLIPGLVSAVANVFVDAKTGKDIGEHVLASIAPSQPSISPPPVPYQLSQQAIDIPLEHPDSATITPQRITPQEAVLLPPPSLANIQAGIEQYKWQMMADGVKPRSNYWG